MSLLVGAKSSGLDVSAAIKQFCEDMPIPIDKLLKVIVMLYLVFFNDMVGYGKRLVISLDIQVLITCCPLCILSSKAERVISCMCGTLHIKHPLTF